LFFRRISGHREVEAEIEVEVEVEVGSKLRFQQ
jgi:hypothetical protein